MKQTKRFFAILALLSISFISSGQGRNSISIEASYDYGIRVPLYGIGGVASYDIFEKGHWTAGAGLGLKHIDTFLGQGGNSVWVRQKEWVMPIFARFGFNYGVGYFCLDAGYHLNLYSRDLDANVKTKNVAVSGFFFTPTIGVRIAKVVYLSASVTWMQKNRNMGAKYIFDPDGVNFMLATVKEFTPTAKLALGVRF